MVFTQHSSHLKIFSFVNLNSFLSKVVCFLFLSIPVAHAGIEYGYHPFGGTGAFPIDASAHTVCVGSRCYTAYNNSQIFASGEAACNAVLNARGSDGSRNFGGYSYPDFSLKSWGAPYTDFVGNTYSANQCILNSTGNGYTFTTSCGFGIFGTCWYPNFEARQMVRCVQSGIPDADWFVAESSPNLCLGNTTLTLTPAPNQKNPRPDARSTWSKDKIPASSTYELIAKVVEGGVPKAGVAVSFEVKVKDGSGEHGVTGGAVHDHKIRERDHPGKVPPSGVTNGSGEVRIKFEAPILAGTHTVTATCDTCSNKTATKDVKVLVPDLVALTADKGTPKKFDLIGNTSGSGLNHPDNHYFTVEAKDTLVNGVIPKLFNAGWGIVGVNDGSLKDGGLFDIEGKWSPSHHEHRTGTEVDIRTNNIAEKKVRDVYEDLCRKENADLDVQTLWHKSDLPPGQEHYHIYLRGAGLDLTKTLGKCCEKYRVQKKDKDGVLLFHTSGKLKGKPIYEFFCEEKTPSN